MPSCARQEPVRRRRSGSKLATIDGKASLLGEFEVFEGDYKKLFDSPAELREGDARGRAEGRGAGVPEESPHRRRAAVASREARSRERHDAPRPAPRVLLLRGAAAALPRPTPAAGVKVPANQRFVLPNGLTIVLVPKKDVPLIAFSGFVRGGALARSGRQAGRRLAGRRPARSRRRQAQRLRIRRRRRRRGRQLQRGRRRRGDHASAASSWRAIARCMIELLGRRADASAFRRRRSSRTTAIARSSSSSRRRIPIRRRSSASTGAPRCSASIPTAARRAAASARWPRITHGDVRELPRRATSAPIAPRWCSPAISMRSG